MGEEIDEEITDESGDDIEDDIGMASDFAEKLSEIIGGVATALAADADGLNAVDCTIVPRPN